MDKHQLFESIMGALSKNDIIKSINEDAMVSIEPSVFKIHNFTNDKNNKYENIDYILISPKAKYAELFSEQMLIQYMKAIKEELQDHAFANNYMEVDKCLKDLDMYEKLQKTPKLSFNTELRPSENIIGIHF